MFKYKLEPILNLKEKMEDNKKRELGLANQLYESAKTEKAKLVEARNKAYEEAKIQNSNRVNIEHLKQLNQYLNYMKQEIHHKEQEIIKSAIKVDEKRSELIEAVKERKILENLKEIKLEEYKEEETRKENNIIDEIVTYKYGLSKKE